MKKRKSTSGAKRKGVSDTKRKARYGISDLVVDEHEQPAKYAKVFDIYGKFLDEVEVYIIGYENEEL